MQTTGVTLDEIRRRRGPFLPVSERLPALIRASGCLDLLARRLVGLFCSVQCPEHIAPLALDVVQTISDAESVIVSGFHAPVERECLEKLLCATAPAVVCPARSLEAMQPAPLLAKPMEQGRVLLLSPFAPGMIRIDAAASAQRNRFIAALADELFIAYAAPGGKTEQLCRDVMTWNKPIFTIDVPENAALMALGARRVTPQNVAEQLSRARMSR